jgi:hypothetical protein
MKISRRCLHPRVLAELEHTGLPYDFEMGTRHIKLRVAGHFIGIIPRGSSAKSESYGQGYAIRNSISQIRRAAKKYREPQAA